MPFDPAFDLEPVASVAAIATDDDISPTPLPEPTLLIETAFPCGQRPRPQGSIAAAISDEELARWNLGGGSAPDLPSNRPGYHPGTRVIVDTSVTTKGVPLTPPGGRKSGARARTLSQSALLAQARRLGYWPFRLCFEEERGADALPPARTRFVVDVGSSGRVAAVRLLGSEFEDRRVTRCLEKATRAFVFEPPPPRRLQFRLEIRLAPGDAPLPKRGPPTPPLTAAPDCLAGIDEQLQRARGSLVDCYAEALVRDHRLWGRIETRIETDETGRFTELMEHESRFPDREMTACVLARLRSLSWPLPENGRACVGLGLRFGEPPARSETAGSPRPANQSSPNRPGSSAGREPKFQLRASIPR